MQINCKSFPISTASLQPYSAKQKVDTQGGAQWTRLCLPSCHPRFESQAHHQCFYQFVFQLCHVEKTKINKKRPIFEKQTPGFSNLQNLTSVIVRMWFQRSCKRFYFQPNLVTLPCVQHVPSHGALQYNKMKAESAQVVSYCIFDKPKKNHPGHAWQCSTSI